MKNKKLLVLASVLSLGLLAGCAQNEASTSSSEDVSSETSQGGESSSVVEVITVTGVTISGGVTTLGAQETVQLSAKVTLSKGEDTLGVTWSSSNDNVASVSATGLVTAGSVTADTNVTITATSKKDGSVKQTITIKILADENVTVFGDKATMTFGEKASLTPNKMVYWNDQGWVSGTSTINEAKTFTEGNTFSIGFSQTDGSSWFGTQLFYKNSSLTVGTPYKLSMKVNASVAGKITINGKVVTLTAGDNDVAVSYIEGAASIDIQFGVDGEGPVLAMDATFEVLGWKDISADKVALAAPTNVAVNAKEGVAGAYILTFDAVEHAAGYMYSVLKDGTALEGFNYVAAKSGDTIDLRKFDTAKYEVSVQAVGDGLEYADSAATKVEINHTKPATIVANTYRADFGEDVVNLAFGEAANAGATPTYWNDQNWCGSNTIVSFAAAKGNQIQFGFSGATIEFGFQLFLSDSNITANSKYRLKMNLWSTAAGDVKINGKAVTLAVGDNIINVEFTASATNEYGQAQGTSLNFQNGSIAAADIKMSNIRWTEVVEGVTDTDAGEAQDEPSDLVEKKTEIAAPVGVVYNPNGTIAFAAVSNAVSYKATIFTDEACTTETTIKDVALANGGSLDLSTLEAGEYYLVVYAVAEDGTVSAGSTAVKVTLSGKLAAPVGVVFTQKTGAIAFAPVTGASSYKATVFTDEALTTKSSVDEVTITNGGTIDITALEPGTYYLVVYAVDGNGELSDGSTAVRFVVKDPDAVVVTPSGTAVVLENGGSATRVEGAGVWIWVDSSSCGITLENFASAEKTATVSMKDAGGVEVAAAAVNDVVISDVTADYFRVYVVLNMAPVDGWSTTIDFTITVGSNTYGGSATFSGTTYSAD